MTNRRIPTIGDVFLRPDHCSDDELYEVLFLDGFGTIYARRQFGTQWYELDEEWRFVPGALTEAQRYENLKEQSAELHIALDKANAIINAISARLGTVCMGPRLVDKVGELQGERDALFSFFVQAKAMLAIGNEASIDDARIALGHMKHDNDVYKNRWQKLAKALGAKVLNCRSIYDKAPDRLLALLTITGASTLDVALERIQSTYNDLQGLLVERKLLSDILSPETYGKLTDTAKQWREDLDQLNERVVEMEDANAQLKKTNKKLQDKIERAMDALGEEM